MIQKSFTKEMGGGRIDNQSSHALTRRCYSHSALLLTLAGYWRWASWSGSVKAAGIETRGSVTFHTMYSVHIVYYVLIFIANTRISVRMLPT